ncbi:hypothetical protein KPL70_018082 [Citrus sinensis]|uniref:Uncharacterized protein n=1 Tax=Citrus clementina TaxID=85681 RepID=V4S5U5_CITCL|nr:hypothetical protein CICLE_v10013035mg [Citrus x clementina]KAH9673368.1 hypothetical protein KPL70_018082 [Citrus sinensis]GAY32260.1 hypothetical protein CUMW_001420 [Citrus unshiu]
MALPSERIKNKNKSSVDEIEVVLRRFGDEQSTLLDQFERLSFEVQLNQAILRRSLSEPSLPQSKCLASAPPQLPVPVLRLRPLMNTQVRQGRRGYGFGKVLKKLFKPILGLKASHKNNHNNGGRKVKEVPDPKNLKYNKAFSKSLRF